MLFLDPMITVGTVLYCNSRLARAETEHYES
jgi:hypothetical protein